MKGKGWRDRRSAGGLKTDTVCISVLFSPHPQHVLQACGSSAPAHPQVLAIMLNMGKGSNSKERPGIWVREVSVLPQKHWVFLGEEPVVPGQADQPRVNSTA